MLLANLIWQICVPCCALLCVRLCVSRSHAQAHMFGGINGNLVKQKANLKSLQKFLALRYVNVREAKW